jgi:hypothetical protein
VWSGRQLDEALTLGPAESLHLALRAAMTPSVRYMHSGWLVLTARPYHLHPVFVEASGVGGSSRGLHTLHSPLDKISSV